jgi:hypothetical protein
MIIYFKEKNLKRFRKKYKNYLTYSIILKFNYLRLKKYMKINYILLR